MTKQEYLDEINTMLKSKPAYLRTGQAVFNYVNEHYGVARVAQFKYGIDCFYDDKKIPDFLDITYRLISINNDHP